MQSPSLLTRPLVWLSSHLWVARVVPLLFVPAIVMLLMRVIWAQAIATTTAALLITIALLLFCIELAWMAYVDLNNVSSITAQKMSQLTIRETDQCSGESAALLTSRTVPQTSMSVTEMHSEACNFLNRFFWTLMSTLVLELFGFYSALFSPPQGAFAVILSQLWFNCLAGVQLFPSRSPAIVLFGPRQRIDVLAANTVAILFLGLWPIFGMRLPAGIGLLTLIALFLVLKYAPLIYTKIKGRLHKAKK